MEVPMKIKLRMRGGNGWLDFPEIDLVFMKNDEIITIQRDSWCIPEKENRPFGKMFPELDFFSHWWKWSKAGKPDKLQEVDIKLLKGK